MRVLLVEDSKNIRQTVGDTLRRSGFAVDICDNGEDGLSNAWSSEYDVIVLDILLPKMDGLTVLRRLREVGRTTPVILLTAKVGIAGRVRGLNDGADDCLGKPFALEELLARVMALTRRRYGQASSTIAVGGLTVDRQRRSAGFRGRPIKLTARELTLLDYLAARTGQVVSRNEIEEHIYDELVEPLSNVVDSTVCILRRKLAAVGAPSMIQTRRGLGYVLEVDQMCDRLAAG